MLSKVLSRRDSGARFQQSSGNGLSPVGRTVAGASPADTVARGLARSPLSEKRCVNWNPAWPPNAVKRSRPAASRAINRRDPNCNR